MSLKVCTDWADQSVSECNQWADQGYNSCNNYRRNCCTWWPCSWGCEIVSWFCTAWVWISNVVCVAWTVITTLVCLVWEVISVILVPITFLIELILAIPIIGRLLGQLINLIQTIVIRVLGIGEAILSAIGFRPLKKLRLCIIILRDDSGPLTTEANLAAQIATTKSVFRNAANIEVLVDGSILDDPALWCHHDSARD